MTDLEFQDQLSRFADFLGNLKKPAQKSKATLYPDLGRATERIQNAAVAAKKLVGTGDEAACQTILIEIRRSIGAWESVNESHGPITWKPSDADAPLTVAPRRAIALVE